MSRVFREQGEGSRGDVKAIHAQEDRAGGGEAERNEAGGCCRVAASRDRRDAILLAFPREHWRCLRTNNPLERILREVRRRTRAVGAFPDGKSALMLAAARLRHVAGTKWGTRRYLDTRLPLGGAESVGASVHAASLASARRFI